jgi:hypothetical protein
MRIVTPPDMHASRVWMLVPRINAIKQAAAGDGSIALQNDDACSFGSMRVYRIFRRLRGDRRVMRRETLPAVALGEDGYRRRFESYGWHARASELGRTMVACT